MTSSNNQNSIRHSTDNNDRSTSNTNSVSLVLQRYRSCNILLNETEWVTQGDGCTTSSSSNNRKDNNSTNDNGISIDLQESNLLPPLPHQHCGLLIYVSFGSTITDATCIKAAETCLHMSILTNGLWGDDMSQLYSIKEYILGNRGCDSSSSSSTDGTSSVSSSITIVPQANLICKVKGGHTSTIAGSSSSSSNKASIQYHNQVKKEFGRYYYDLFVDTIYSNVYEWTMMMTFQQPDTKSISSLPSSYMEWKKKRYAAFMQSISRSRNDNNVDQTVSLPDIKFDPSIPPEDIFRTNLAYTTIYNSFDSTTGIPDSIKDSNNNNNTAVSKSQIKKLQKIQDIHRTKHTKWKCQQQQPNIDEISTSETKISSARTNDVGAPTTAPTSRTITIPSSNECDPPPTMDWDLVFQDLRKKKCIDTNNTIDHSGSAFNQVGNTVNKALVTIVAGTFGKRQGITIHSDMGPFCHIVQQ